MSLYLFTFQPELIEASHELTTSSARLKLRASTSWGSPRLAAHTYHTTHHICYYFYNFYNFYNFYYFLNFNYYYNYYLVPTKPTNRQMKHMQHVRWNTRPHPEWKTHVANKTRSRTIETHTHIGPDAGCEDLWGAINRYLIVPPPTGDELTVSRASANRNATRGI